MQTKEEKKACQVVYRAAHREEKKSYNAAYNVANREEISAQKATYYVANRERDRTRSRSYQAVNREKIKTQRASYRAANKEAIRAQRLGKYGLSLGTFQLMRRRQKNACGICGETFLETPYVDHCHKTGEVRGLLCRRCNTALGSFKDSYELLRGALEYLEHGPKDRIQKATGPRI